MPNLVPCSMALIMLSWAGDLSPPAVWISSQSAESARIGGQRESISLPKDPTGTASDQGRGVDLRPRARIPRDGQSFVRRQNAPVPKRASPGRLVYSTDAGRMRAIIWKRSGTRGRSRHRAMAPIDAIDAGSRNVALFVSTKSNIVQPKRNPMEHKGVQRGSDRCAERASR